MAKAHDLTWNRDDPLEPCSYSYSGKMQKEPKRAIQALRDFAFMGTMRSIEKLWESYLQLEATDRNYIKPAKHIAFLKSWSMYYAWQERVKLYDKRQEEKRQAETDEFWRQARGTIPQEDYRQGKRLREIIDKTFEKAEDFIEETRSVVDGVVIIRQSLNVRAMTDALKVASDIQRKAAGLDKEKKIAWTGSITDLPRPLLERIVAGEDPDEVVKDLSKYAGTSETENNEANPGTNSG